MSVLLAATAALATPVATPLPSASPLVIHDQVTKIVYAIQASPQLVSGLMLAGLAVAGWLASRLHQLFESLSKHEDGWSTGFNVSLQVAVGLVVSFFAGVMAGTLHPTLQGLEDFLGSFLIVMGTSQTRYMFFKWVQSIGSGATEPNPVSTEQARNLAAEQSVPQKASL